MQFKISDGNAKLSSTPAPTSYIGESGTDDLDGLQINLYGPPGCGKTWTALSASKNWPTSPCEPRTKYVVLDDVLHLQYDTAALVGLLPHKIKIKYRLDAQRMISELGLVEGLQKLSMLVQRFITEHNKVRYVIHDTITSLDQESVRHWGKAFSADTRKLYSAHLNIHRGYWSEMSHLPHVSNIYLFHEKFIEEPTGKDASPLDFAKAQSKRLEDRNVNILPHVTGSGLNIYTNHASIEWSVLAEPRVEADGGGFIRTLCPTSYNGRRAKNRFQTLFPKPIEPNLSKVFQTIRNAAKGEEPTGGIINKESNEKQQEKQPSQTK